MSLTPYIFFDGRCEEAIAFYKAAIGAEQTMFMRWRDGPDPAPPGAEDRVMHAELRIGEAMMMLSDGMPGGATQHAGYCIYLAARDAHHARGLFDALADGGEVRMPLAATFWSPAFGVVADRFGVPWMIGAQQDAAA